MKKTWALSLLLLLIAFIIIINRADMIDNDMIHFEVSSVFAEGELIPEKYTCEAQNAPIPLTFSKVPSEAKTLVLIMDDPDAVSGTWTHWMVFNVPAQNSFRLDDIKDYVSGRNSWGKTGYGGPCPPSGIHRYFLKAYALDAELDLQEGADRGAVEKAMRGHIIGSGQLMGRYGR